MPFEATFSAQTSLFSWCDVVASPMSQASTQHRQLSRRASSVAFADSVASIRARAVVRSLAQSNA